MDDPDLPEGATGQHVPDLLSSIATYTLVPTSHTTSTPEPIINNIVDVELFENEFAILGSMLALSIFLLVIACTITLRKSRLTYGLTQNLTQNQTRQDNIIGADLDETHRKTNNTTRLERRTSLARHLNNAHILSLPNFDTRESLADLPLKPAWDEDETHLPKPRHDNQSDDVLTQLTQHDFDT